MIRVRKSLAGIAAALALWLGAAGFADRARADDDPQDLVDKAQVTALTLLRNPEYKDLAALVAKARAVLIIPSYLKAGFLLGGSGGTGVLLAREAGSGDWSPPAFYTMGGASIGLQIGGETQELVLAIMTDKGLDAILDRKVKFGADADIAVGEIGKAVAAGTGIGFDADIYSFAKSAGLFGGVSIGGGVVAPRAAWNQAYYGADATPRGILVEHRYTKPAADALRAALNTHAG